MHRPGGGERLPPCQQLCPWRGALSIAFSGFTYKGAGSHSTTTPSRVLNSYDRGTIGSVKVVSRGVSCR
jgi:hypothetical protein